MGAPRCYYTLQYNYWLDRRRPLEMFSFLPARNINAIYDFTVWKDGKVVAAWAGTESDAFNAMLHLSAHEERQADTGTASMPVSFDQHLYMPRRRMT